MKLYQAHIFHSEYGPFTSETVEDAVGDVNIWGEGKGEVYFHTDSPLNKGYAEPQIQYDFHTIYVRRVNSGEVIGRVNIVEGGKENGCRRKRYVGRPKGCICI